MPESSQALFHGYSLRTQRDAESNRRSGRGWRVTVTDASGNPVHDPAANAPWMSQTEAEKHAEEITREYMKAQGEPYADATDSPKWE